MKFAIIFLLLPSFVLANSFNVAGTVQESVAVGGGYVQQCTQVGGSSGSDQNMGAVLGGVVGAIIGSSVGQGHGNEAAQIIGAIGGTIAGANASRPTAPQMNCHQVYQPPQYFQTRVNINGQVITFQTSSQYRPGQRVNVRFDGYIQ